jgi:hypothetical protein
MVLLEGYEAGIGLFPGPPAWDPLHTTLRSPERVAEVYFSPADLGSTRDYWPG